MSRTISSDTEAPLEHSTVFQWRLFRWYPGVTASGYDPRSCSASSGSHFSEILRGEDRSALIANSLPFTLKTDDSGPNGKSSYAPGNERHSFRSAAAVTRPIVPARLALQ